MYQNGAESVVGLANPAPAVGLPRRQDEADGLARSSCPPQAGLGVVSAAFWPADLLVGGATG